MIDLECQFEIGHCNGSMSLTILYNNKIIEYHQQINNTKLIVKTKIDLPGVLTINVFNKNMSVDTKIDDTGKILADKYVKLQNLSLGHVLVRTTVLQQLCEYTRNNQTVNDIYWGFPGTIKIKFLEKNVVTWHLLHNPINFNLE